MVMSFQFHAPATLLRGVSDTNWIGGCVGPRADLDTAVAKNPSRSQSLH